MMERLVEGTVGVVFRQTLTPAELGRKLQKLMSSNARPSVNSAIVPNEYVVDLHPRDFAQFKDFPAGLARQMEAHLAQFAGENRYTVVGRIRVTIQESDSARRRDPHIVATIKDAGGHNPAQSRHAAPADRTEAYRVMPAQGFTLSVIAGVARGSAFRVPAGNSTIGRASDNALVVDAPDVSRKHARLECSSGRLRIYDLNSTNGTRVNGDPVRIADLTVGDEITLGNQVMRVNATECV